MTPTTTASKPKEYKVDPAALAIVQKVRKKHGDESIMLGSEIKNVVIPRITTGSLALDVALGGGWAATKWNEVVAFPSNGKTALALKTIAANQKANPDYFTFWFASEEFVIPYAEMLGVDLRRVMIVDTNVMEVVYETATTVMEDRAADCIVIDSLPALAPIRSLEGTMEDLQPGLHAFLTGKFFQQAQPAIKRSLMVEDRPCTGLVINQWRHKIMQGPGDPRTTPGGGGKDFYFAIRVELQRTEWILNTRKKRIGQMIKMKNIKNKTAPPGTEGFVDYYFADGNGHEAGSFDTLKDIFLVASDDRFGVIAQRGSMYDLPDGQSIKGKEAVLQEIRDNPILADQIVNEVMGLVKRSAPDVVLTDDAEPELKERESAPKTTRTVARKKS